MTTDTKRLRERLGGVESPMMQGDNLAILLCSHFDNPDQEEGDESGWTPDAIAGMYEVLDAIHVHYSGTIDALEARVAEAETIAGIASIPDIAGLAERLEAAERQRDDILARIHRDGGHYIEHHGVEKAVADADEIVAKLFSERDALRSTSTIIRQRDEAVEALKVAQGALGRCHCQFDFYSREHLKQVKVEQVDREAALKFMRDWDGAFTIHLALARLLAQTRLAERARIVTWLRDKKNILRRHYPAVAHELADAIQRGDHEQGGA